MNQFNVLMIQPVGPLQNPPPMSLAILGTVLKKHNIAVQVFDTTFYQDPEQLSLDEVKTENLNVKPFSFDGFSIPHPTNHPEDDLQQLVERNPPDLIAITILEPTWPLAERLLDALTPFDIPVFAGGVFPTFAPDIALSHPAVNGICIGEGEQALLDLCLAIKGGSDFHGIDNLWVKKNDDTIARNPIRPVLDLERLPIPEFDFFDPARLLRPMAGRIYRTIPIESNRGCPYQCSYCNSPANAQIYRQNQAGQFFRKKTIERICAELKYYKTNYHPEYFFFLSDTFLVMTDSEFDTFIRFYGKEIDIPFWMQSRIETITAEKARQLREVGCHRMSIGLEHGNEEFRQRMLKKNFKNKDMIEKTQIIADAGIPFTLNNIIGFPDETRELIFDTIKLNAQIPFDTANAYAFAPFHGTPLREYCIERGYIEKAYLAGCFTTTPPLDMPQLSAAEIEGLRKTFILYARMPTKYWPQIEQAEKDSPEGRLMMEKIRDLCQSRYMSA